MKNDVILSIQHASYRYKDANEDEYALKDVSYDFEKGKIYAIRGRSGTGKTTLLSLISGLEKCSEGNIIFDGKNLKDLNLDKYRNHDIGIVFQSYNLLPFMTVSENIILSMDISGIKVKDKQEEALRLMKSVGLKEEVKREEKYETLWQFYICCVYICTPKTKLKCVTIKIF